MSSPSLSRSICGVHSEDYATIDNAVVLNDEFDDTSCTTTRTSVPAGWRLADWDAGVGSVSDPADLAALDPHLFLWNKQNISRRRQTEKENGWQKNSTRV